MTARCARFLLSQACAQIDVSYQSVVTAMLYIVLSPSWLPVFTVVDSPPARFEEVKNEAMLFRLSSHHNVLSMAP